MTDNISIQIIFQILSFLFVSSSATKIVRFIVLPALKFNTHPSIAGTAGESTYVHFQISGK